MTEKLTLDQLIARAPNDLAKMLCLGDTMGVDVTTHNEGVIKMAMEIAAAARADSAADVIRGLRGALNEAYSELLQYAYNTGYVRDGKWSHGFMSDGEWLADTLGLDPKKASYDDAEVQRLMGEQTHPALKAADTWLSQHT